MAKKTNDQGNQSPSLNPRLGFSPPWMIDQHTIDNINKLLEPIEELADVVREHKDALSAIDDCLGRGFPLLEAMEVRHVSPTISFFTEQYQSLEEVVTSFIHTYQEIGSSFEYNLAQVNLDEAPSGLPTISTVQALQLVPALLTKAKQLYFDIKNLLPQALQQAYQRTSEHNHYLHQRFVKSVNREQEQKKPSHFLFGDEEHEPPVAYTKIQLIESNPILTDVLLGLAQSMPEYTEKTVRGKRKQKSKVIRELSQYAVLSSAERLISISQSNLLHYFFEPNSFFRTVGDAVRHFYFFFETHLEPVHKRILNLAHDELIADTKMRRTLTDGSNRIKRGLERLTSTEFDPITQKEDEYLPDNRKERDYFKVRGQLLDLLYNTLLKLSPLKDELPDERQLKREIARETVLKAVKLKSRIYEITTSPSGRKLRQDRRSDNEYYEGTQVGMHGYHFSFERKPAPQVSMQEVIGKSFDQAKQHLEQVVKTGQFSHLMRVSAPGGKVRSNILLIGPYGCGKTEFARAVCADPNVLGAAVSIRDVLTAYVHESVNNVGRVYDAAKELYQQGRELKPVVLVLDEFDGWFARGEHGNLADIDMRQMEKTLVEVLDGMGDYNGIITLAMTNEPKAIPKNVIRRFRYVDVVGQLSAEERAAMLKMYLEKTLPVHDDVQQQYTAWAEKLKDAPGDVIRKVVDEVHFSLLPEYIQSHPQAAARVEDILSKRGLKKGELDEQDTAYVKQKLARYRLITPLDVERSMEKLLSQPQIRAQIDAARKVYREAQALLDEIVTGSRKYGLRESGEHFR